MHRSAPLRRAATIAALLALPLAALAPAPAMAAPADDAADELIEDGELLQPRDLPRAERLDELAERSAGDPFYSPPAELPGDNGAVIRTEPSTFHLDPLRAIRIPGDAERIMYRSEDADGRPIAVTGTILTPSRPWRGGGERPLVGYSASTQGMADRCAPSRQLAVGMEYEGPILTALLGAGYEVVLTDLEGLGTPGPHAYGVSGSAGRSVLDAVRAARTLDDVEDRPIGLVGYSQGGNAVASAAELAPDYAPELEIAGVFAGAVPADFQQVADRIDGSFYSGLLLYALTGIASSAGIDPDAYLNDRGREAVARANDSCVVSGLLTGSFRDTARLTARGVPLKTLVRTEPELRSALDAQRLGTGRAPETPVMLAHSLGDDVVPYRQATALRDRWCAAGGAVQMRPLLTPTHLGGYAASAPHLVSFLRSTFDGRSPVRGC